MVALDDLKGLSQQIGFCDSSSGMAKLHGLVLLLDELVLQQQKEGWDSQLALGWKEDAKDKLRTNHAIDASCEG